MFEVSDIITGLFRFVIASVSFLYGTRICWGCGRACNAEVMPSEKKQIIKSRMPIGFAVYSFSFLIVFGTILDGGVTIITISLITALVLSQFMISVTMPNLRQKRPTPTKEQS